MDTEEYLAELAQREAEIRAKERASMDRIEVERVKAAGPVGSQEMIVPAQPSTFGLSKPKYSKAGRPKGRTTYSRDELEQMTLKDRRKVEARRREATNRRRRKDRYKGEALNDPDYTSKRIDFKRELSFIEALNKAEIIPYVYNLPPLIAPRARR